MLPLPRQLASVAPLAQLLSGALVFQKLDMGEGEEALPLPDLALPVAVHVGLGDFDDVPRIESQGRSVVCVGDSVLGDTGEGRQLLLLGGHRG